MAAVLAALGHEDGALLLAFGGEDLGLLDAFGGEDRGALSRSARICFSIASLTDFGGSMALISTRVTRMPHLPDASSRTPLSRALILSREVSVCSRSMLPMTLREHRRGDLVDRLDVVDDLVVRRPRISHLEETAPCR